jgi:signal transduction histidine kinase
MRKMSSHQKARIAFASAVLLMLLSGVAASVTISRLRSAQEWISHGHDVENAISDLNASLSRSGRLQTEYVSLGNPDSLRDYQAVVPQISEELHSLDRLTADNRVQQSRCTQLENLIGERVRWMDESVALKRRGQSDPVKQAEITRQIAEVTSDTGVLSQQMQAEERGLLERRTASAERWFAWIVAILLSTLACALGMFWVHYRLLHNELLALEQAQKSLQALSARLMNLQDEERRRFSRELHDSLGQDLAALKMLLPTLEKDRPNDPNLLECLQIVDKSISETRTISHLLHPPLLDEAGLAVAIRWYVDGFAQRSGVQVKVTMPDDLGRLPSATELTLFRILQESLTNIHRHAGASRAEVSLASLPGGLDLKIRDFGKGIPPATLRRFRSDSTGAGVGLAGMRERIRELGGRFEIFSDKNGTLIEVTVPVQADAASGHLTKAIGT